MAKFRSLAYVRQITGTPRTRIGLLTAAAISFALALPSASLAGTNTVAFSGKLAMASMPTATAPANTGFEWAHHITTSPAGNQPDTAESFTVLFPAPIVSNARDYPACAASSVDGQQRLSAECQNAMVGSGTATMYAGSPGSPLSNSVREDLNVTVLNGAPAGSALLLVVNSAPAAPVAITNRVIAGTVAPADGYAFGVRFVVPADLQQQLGLSLTITDLDVTISGTPRPITAGATTAGISYLQISSCSAPAAARQATSFRMAGSSTPVTQNSDASIDCTLGTFPDPAGYPTAPYTSPRLPVPPAQPAISRSGSSNLGRVKARRNGSIPLAGVVASCPAGASGPCQVTGRAARGRVLAATLSQRVAAGAGSPVTLTLTKAGKRLLARSKRVPLTVSLQAAAPAGGVAKKTLKLTLVR